MPFRLPSARINWVTSAFLGCTALGTIIAVPWYLWTYGVDAFQVVLFLAFFAATGLSITVGYHRLFSHLSFKASWPVRLFTLVFGAAAFENSVLEWASDHRNHHKHVDGDDDPYDISKGFWHAHIGWILFKLNAEPPRDNVRDLERDPLVVWQERWYYVLAVAVGFLLPAALGWLYGGPSAALGGFLLAGVARVTFVQHMTFFINSLCHTIGSQPYSGRCSARDSWIMALFTFGEGYHNYHHEFQHDYRNGVKWWQWDPTKWTVWTLDRLRLVRDLRRVPDEKILIAQVAEALRRVEAHLASPRFPLADRTGQLILTMQARLRDCQVRLEAWKSEYADQRDLRIRNIRASLRELRRELRAATAILDRMGVPV
ncbi:MAG: fatty acid desaturase [Opitutaceae bacterium]|nr:fatty acid desaturase [Opitutaceae bacterium]